MYSGGSQYIYSYAVKNLQDSTAILIFFILFFSGISQDLGYLSWVD